MFTERGMDIDGAFQYDLGVTSESAGMNNAPVDCIVKECGS